MFNLCLFVLPMAGAAAVIVIARDHLYAYEYTPNGARSISRRVERLNASLIQTDFDRQRQWDNMVAMELMANDDSAARGFLLSGTEMLPPRTAAILRQAASEGAGDSAIEVAALQLLLPGTRERYQANVQLLSLRPNSETPGEEPAETLGDPRDFELMARALLGAPETDPLQFVLTGFALGLGGDMSARMNEGAVALLAATRREDFPNDLSDELHILFAEAMPLETFRAAARVSAEERGAPGDFDNASVAFAASINPQAAARVRAMLAEVGDISAATSAAAAATMLTQATTLSDFERLRLLAQTSGDRAAAAAKRLPRDGRLLLAARGELEFNRDLLLALGAVGLALAGLLFAVLSKLVQAARDGVRRLNHGDDDFDHHDDYDSELLEISTNNWRPL
ncbi:MAG: hypothetical protein JNL81_09620 [Hyphomonadaceae bacterium]|nr:hypothetical protein [Hyphomonadaceae bacterium]